MSSHASIRRAVVDANVLVRALLSRAGPSARLLRAAAQGSFQLVLSPFLLRELRLGLLQPRVRRRYGLAVEDIAAFVADVGVIADIVPGHLEVHYASRDPKDNPVLACALEGGADVLVTDDRRDLLPLKYFHGVQIVSVPDFLRSLP